MGAELGFPDVSSESAQVIKQTVAVTKQAPWRALELAATALFLARQNSLSDHEAMSAALELKPHCKSFQAQAKTILAELGLISN